MTEISVECYGEANISLISGLYRVIATNPFGSAHSKATATVKKVLGDALIGFIDG